MWKTLEEEKPKNNQIILIKAKNQKIPEVGIWQDYDINKSEVYIICNDESEISENIEKWMEIPDYA